MKYVRLQVRVDCPECGLPVPLNGPWRSFHCHSCQADSKIDAAKWGDILESVRDDLGTGGRGRVCPITIFDEFNTRILAARAMPRCPQCKASLPGSDTIETETTLVCPDCGRKIPAFPVPQWLSELVPSAAVLLNATLQDTPAGPDAGGVKPVMFACLQCGSPLKVDGTTRVLTCGSCDADCYLPDPLWLRLHPAAVMAKWIVGFQKRGAVAKEMMDEADD